MPGVAPSMTGAAPGSTKNPPGFKCFAATWDEMADVQTDCFNAKSTFLMKLAVEAFPPHHPPATLMTANNCWFYDGLYNFKLYNVLYTSRLYDCASQPSYKLIVWYLSHKNQRNNTVDCTTVLQSVHDKVSLFDEGWLWNQHVLVRRRILGHIDRHHRVRLLFKIIHEVAT